MQFGADFSALINRFSPDPHAPIALAVSGGSDSLALLHLSSDWARREDRSVIVFTVDHGLRPDARAEADHVAALCDHMRVAHQTLVWETPKPSQNAARRARYGLIAKAMASENANCLLTGHTLDDVMETVFIRRRRGVRGGLSAGPAQAAPFPAWPAGQSMTVLRPLLHARRSALRDFLQTHDTVWMEDPSNQDQSFERVQVRRFLQRHPRLHEGLIPVITTLLAERAQLDARMSRALAEVAVTPDGLIEVPTEHMTVPDRIRLLSLLARIASGGDRDPRRHAVFDMVASLEEPGARQTLGGAWFQRTRIGFKIGRDPAQSSPAYKAPVFDGRFARDPDAQLPILAETSFLVRHARPSDSDWREILSDRIKHMRLCFQSDIGPMGAE